MTADRIDILWILRRRAGLILATALIAAGGAVLFTLAREESYESTAEVLLDPVGFDETVIPRDAFPTVDLGRDAATELELFLTEEVTVATAEMVGGDLAASDIEGMVDVLRASDSSVVEVIAAASEPGLAAGIANGVARNAIEFRRVQERARINQAIGLVRDDLTSLSEGRRGGTEGKALRAALTELLTRRSLQTGDARLLRLAEADAAAAIGSSPLANAAVGGILGLLVGAALAFLLDRLDRRVRGPGELGEAFGHPVLARVPRSKGLSHGPVLPPERLPSADAEAFRLLRSRLRYFNVDRALKVVMVTSPATGDGKTTVAASLAGASALAGDVTLLIEADMRRPALDGVSHGPGLAELLSGQADLDSVRRTLAVGEGGQDLDVIVAGAIPPDPSRLLESDLLAATLRELRSRYSLIVIDVPSISIAADAIPLVRLVDGVLVVGRVGKTTSEEARMLASQLADLDTEVLGVVANSVSEDERLGYG